MRSQQLLPRKSQKWSLHILVLMDPGWSSRNRPMRKSLVHKTEFVWFCLGLKKTILRKCEWTSEAQIIIMADEVAFNIPVNNHPSRSARQAL